MAVLRVQSPAFSSVYPCSDMKKIFLELAVVLAITFPAVMIIAERPAQALFICASILVAYTIIFLSMNLGSRRQDRRWRV